jgi:hypothetical protein
VGHDFAKPIIEVFRYRCVVIGNEHAVGRVSFQLVQLGSDIVEAVTVDGLALALAGCCVNVGATYPSTV